MLSTDSCVYTCIYLGGGLNTKCKCIQVVGGWKKKSCLECGRECTLKVKVSLKMEKP